MVCCMGACAKQCFLATAECLEPHLLLLGSIVQLREERPEQGLARLPAAERVRVMAQQERQLLVRLALHLLDGDSKLFALHAYSIHHH